MPSPHDVPAKVDEIEATLRAYEEEVIRELEARLKVAIYKNKAADFNVIFRSLRKRGVAKSRALSVYEGVVEQQPSGLYDAALQTEAGRLVLRNAQRSDLPSTDPQLLPSAGASDESTRSELATPDKLIDRLASTMGNEFIKLIFEIELTRFNTAQRERLLPLLWHYIVSNRDSSDENTLHAVGSAIRKYIAIMPMDDMGRLAVILEPGHNAPLPIQLEIEVAKMVYRNFEIFPPVTLNPYPALSGALWEMVQAYVNPRLLLRDKHSAAASLCIQALVAMRSEFAVDAVNAAIASPYRWFAEIVLDSLDRLFHQWCSRNTEAAAWLTKLRDVEIVGA